MRTLNLDILINGLPALTPIVGAFLMEAAVVCLTMQGHKSGVVLKIEGDYELDLKIVWSQSIGEASKKSWQDLREAAEYGGMALAVLAIEHLTEFNYFERIPQGFGFDFWLGRYEGKHWEEEDVIKRAKLVLL